MHSGTGEFVGEERAQHWMARIKVGEVVKIKGEELEVTVIGRKEITLKLLSREEREMVGYADLAYAESQRQLKDLLKHQK